MLVSIVIPAFNEEDVIDGHLDAIVAHCGPKPWDHEVLVVDDGSTDRTAELVEAKAKLHPQIRLIRQRRNRGKGCAVRTGLLAAGGDVRGFTDADASTPIAELDRVLPLLESGGASVVIGSRAKRDAQTRVVAKWHRVVIGRAFNGVLRVLLRLRDRDGRPLADTQCGFKWFTAEAAEAIAGRASVDGFAFDVEFLHLANLLGCGVVELPVNWADRGESSVNLFVDPLKMFYRVATVRWRHRGVRHRAHA
jgi:dolichyl-phosphate beta-glucosyltransferase